MQRIELEVEGVVARGVLFEDRAPRTCAKIRALLPIEDRTIQVRWSGAAWRTEKNYPLEVGEVENPVTVLRRGTSFTTTTRGTTSTRSGSPTAARRGGTSRGTSWSPTWGG